MFVIILRLSARRELADAHFPDHKAWLSQGFEDGVFELAGRLTDDIGGAILARGASRAEIEARIARDPFVLEGVVDAEILELIPSLSSDAMTFLIEQEPQ